MNTERPDLSAAFAPPRGNVDRAAALTGLLPTTRPRPRQLPEPPPSSHELVVLHPEPAEHDAAAAPARSAPEPKPKTARPARTATKVSDSADTAAHTAVYLEPDLLTVARAERNRRGVTWDELVVQAFGQVSDDDLRSALNPLTQPAPATGMPTRQRRARGTGGIQVQLYLSGPQRIWLDTRCAELGASSRSGLVATALRLHLQL